MDSARLSVRQFICHVRAPNSKAKKNVRKTNIDVNDSLYRSITDAPIFTSTREKDQTYRTSKTGRQKPLENSAYLA